jgi:hypothetical protein
MMDVFHVVVLALIETALGSVHANLGCGHGLSIIEARWGLTLSLKRAVTAQGGSRIDSEVPLRRQSLRLPCGIGSILTHFAGNSF